MKQHTGSRWSLMGLLAFAALTGRVAANPVGDFDGDGLADLAVYCPTSGTWLIEASSAGSTATNWGWRESRPVPGDYDGDGLTDLAVFERASSNWFITLSQSGSNTVVHLGLSEGHPIPADYDGDGLADPALFHRKSGQWYIRFSSSGNTTNFQLGNARMRPVPRDYDGDHLADPAVYEPATGNWHIRYSTTQSNIVLNWGWPKAVAVPEDYDGDGLCDLAVYSRSNGVWMIRQSSDTQLVSFALGGPDCCPIPSYRDGAIENLIILCFGDSITYGTGSSLNGPPTGYPLRLEQILEPLFGGHCIVINCGKPGESTSSGRTRLRGYMRWAQPDLTLIMQGVNDTFFKKSNSSIEYNIRKMIAYAQSAGSQVILSTLTPVIHSAYRNRTQQERRIESFNPRIPQIARATGTQYVDNWSAITSQTNWQADLIEQWTANHPNDAGYILMAENWLRKIVEGKLNGLYY